MLANSLAAGVHQMAAAMPQIDERSLVADPVFESNASSLTIWLSEQDRVVLADNTVARFVFRGPSPPLRCLSTNFRTIMKGYRTNGFINFLC